MGEKIKNIILSIVFSLFIISVFIINVFKKDNDISVSERRKLEQFPKLSISSIFDGSFFKKFDNYSTDQFVKRDELRLIKANIELKTRGNYKNLYYYNDHIVEQLYPLDEESITNFINRINNIKNKYLKNNKIYLSIVPDKNYYVSSGNLKLDYEKIQNMVINGIDCEYIDIFNKLSIDNYYMTDSHWKEEDLTNLIKEFSNKMDFNIMENYSIKKITDFKGVYASRIPIKVKNDEIKILSNNIIDNSTVYNYDSKKYENVYNLDKVNSLDKYDTYLSGAVSLLKINSNIESSKKLIIFRDSYGSSIAPLFLGGYSEVILVDIRYISSSLLENYIDFNDYDVLFLYSTSLINNSYTLK